jgi:hypothetical protein
MAVEMRCRKHPAYMAQRFPSCACYTCKNIWYAVQQLKNSRCDYILRFFTRVNRSKQ